GEEDQIVMACRLLEEGPTVVDVRGHAWVLEGVVRIALDTNVMNPRIDFHRIDVLGAQAEGDRHAVTGAAADDEHAGRHCAPVLVRKAVDGNLVEPSLRDR